MPKFLVLSSYTAEGVKVLAREGGSKRKAAIEAMFKNVGGKLETFCYAFGEFDIVAIAEVPDIETGTGMILAINASGLAKTRSYLLMTPEEMDKATKVKVDYQPPKG